MSTGAVRTFVIVASAAVVCSSGQAALADARADAIVAALAARTATIAAYRVAVTAHVRMRNFPFLRAVFRGTTQYTRPGQFSVALGNATLANDYQAAFNTMGDPAVWQQDYSIALDPSQASNPDVAALRLDPKTPGPIDHTVAFVRLSTMTVDQIQWYYTDGGRVIMQQSYAPVNNVLMVAHQDIDIAMPSARLFAQADLTGYAMTNDLHGAVAVNHK